MTEPAREGASPARPPARPPASPEATKPKENEFGDVRTGVAGRAAVDPNSPVGEQGPVDLEPATPNVVLREPPAEPTGPVVRGPDVDRMLEEGGGQDETVPGGSYVVEGQTVDAWGRPLAAGQRARER
jgi:hypothetical protein